MSIVWIKQNSIFNTDKHETNGSVTCDNNDDVVIVYSTQGNSSGNTNANYGYNDLVVMKMNVDGDVLWIKQNNIFNSTGDELYMNVACDSNNNIYVAYVSTGSTSGNTNQGGRDVVIMKMDLNGNVIWIKQNNTFNGLRDDQYTGVVCDSNNNVFVVFSLDGSSSGNIGSGGKDIVVMKLVPNGDIAWIKQNNVFNTSSSEMFPTIACGLNDDIYITYYTSKATSGNTNTGTYDIVIMRMTNNGDVVWIKQNNIFNSSNYEYDPLIACDLYGNSYVTYRSRGATSGNTNIGGYDTVVLKMNIDGDVVWIKQNNTFNNSVDDINKSIRCDTYGNVYVSYYTKGISSGNTNTGGYDMVVMKMTPSGDIEWIKQNNIFNTTGTDIPHGIAFDSNNNLYIAYNTMGSSSGNSNLGGYDLVVMKWSTVNPLHFLSLNMSGHNSNMGNAIIAGTDSTAVLLGLNKTF